MFKKSLSLLAALTGLSEITKKPQEADHLALAMDDIRRDPGRAYIQKGKSGKHRLSGRGTRNWLGRKATSWYRVPFSSRGRQAAARWRRQHCSEGHTKNQHCEMCQ